MTEPTPLRLPAISLWQPWASLIAVGVKRHETRHWRCPERLIGQRVLIHAAKRAPDAEKKRGHASFKRQVDNGRFRSGQPWTFAAARDALLEEVWRHGPTSVTLSTNFQPGKNGPQEGKRRPHDEGVAVYFQRHGKPT